MIKDTDKVGIIDGGFLDANKHISLLPHFEEKRGMYYKNFVTPDLSPYAGSRDLNDKHDITVWELIGGVHPEKEVQYGLATQALFLYSQNRPCRFRKEG